MVQVLQLLIFKKSELVKKKRKKEGKEEQANR